MKKVGAPPPLGDFAAHEAAGAAPVLCARPRTGGDTAVAMKKVGALSLHGDFAADGAALEAGAAPVYLRERAPVAARGWR